MFKMFSELAPRKCSKRRENDEYKSSFINREQLISTVKLKFLFYRYSLTIRWGIFCPRPLWAPLMIFSLYPVHSLLYKAQFALSMVVKPSCQGLCHCRQKTCSLGIYNHSKFSSCTEVSPPDVWGENILLMWSPECPSRSCFGKGNLSSVTWRLCGRLSVVLGPFLMFAV